MCSIAHKPNREVLILSQQVRELIGIILMFLPFAFFVYHGVANTGFYTARFGPVEMVCFFGPMLLSMTAPLARALTGRRNPGRPFEIVTNALLALASLWLLHVFPFDFTHFTDALPGAVRFLFTWINSDIGRLVLILQVLVGSLVASLTAVKYLAVSWHDHAMLS